MAQTVASIVQQYAASLVCSNGRPSPAQAPGGIVAVYFEGQPQYFPFGYIDSNGDAATEDTVFGLASVTKTFTTSILS